MTPRFRRPLRLLAIAAAILVVFYVGLWFWQAAATRQRVDALIESGHGGALALAGTVRPISGFPFWIEAEVDDAVVTGLARLPGGHVTAPQLIYRFHPLTPWNWTVLAPHGIALAVPTAGGETRIAAAEATADVGPRKDVFRSYNIRAGGVEVAGLAEPVKLRSIRFRLELPDAAVVQQAGPRVGFALTLDGLTLPRRQGPLGPVIDTIDLEGQFQGTLPHERLAIALAAWRDSGGTIELRHAHVGWDRLELDAEGTAALDRDMQPEANFNAEVRDWQSVIDALVDTGTLSANNAGFAKFALAMLGGGDGGQTLKAPITLQNGQVSIEKAKLARVPHLEWP